MYKTLERKIDFVMGLSLSRLDRRKLTDGNYNFGDQPSINQTTVFTRYTPIFLNVEIKKPQTSSDPRLQLAVWIAAEFKKRLMEGWDRSIPVMAITVDGHAWSLYIVYEPGFESAKLTRILFYLLDKVVPYRCKR